MERTAHTAKLAGISQSLDKPRTIIEQVAYYARVSNPSNQNNDKTSDRLIKYLIKHKHWSPFEMVHLNFEVFTTRSIGRQLLRHRSFSFQEFSQRYSSEIEFVDEGCYRMQAEKNRQSSSNIADEDTNRECRTLTTQALSLASNAYSKLLEMGIAREMARFILPEGFTGTTMYVAGTLEIVYTYDSDKN